MSSYTLSYSGSSAVLLEPWRLSKVSVSGRDMGPQQELILSIILGLSLGTTPSGASSRPLLHPPQHSYSELEGISQVVQTRPVHLLLKKLGPREE